ncbi:hypothetical protein Tco_0983595 [Tanacetum coccineum]
MVNQEEKKQIQDQKERKEKERIGQGTAKTEDPHKEVGKLEKDGDKVMKEENERRLLMQVKMIDEGKVHAKTEDPHKEVRKLEKDGDKAMKEENERRLRMQVNVVKIFAQANQKP